MKIVFEKDTMPDELYNALLQHFVNEAVGLGVEVSKHTRFENWKVECEVKVPLQ
jgi:hypothetical protein